MPSKIYIFGTVSFAALLDVATIFCSAAHFEQPFYVMTKDGGIYSDQFAFKGEPT